MNLREGTGFKHLSLQDKQVYKELLGVFSSMADSFICPKSVSGVDLMRIMHTVLGDNPSVIYFDKNKFTTEESIFEKRIFLTRIFPKSQELKNNSVLEEIANKIVSSIKQISKDEYSLIFNLYNYLQINVLYDKVELDAVSRGMGKNPASHNAYGALVNRLAVCDGFSSAFSLLAQKLGFECMIVFGRSEYSSSSIVEHAWNIVKTKNNYYHMDITWDARRYVSSGEFSYDYFMLADGDISKDHAWNKKSAPPCPEINSSYYLKNALFANNLDRVKQIIKETDLKNSNVFRLKLSPSIRLPDKAGGHLAQMVLSEVVKPGTRKEISYYWNDKTRCFFAKIS